MVLYMSQTCNQPTIEYTDELSLTILLYGLVYNNYVCNRMHLFSFSTYSQRVII